MINDERLAVRMLEEQEQISNTKPSHPLKAYAGTYSHRLYGNIEVIEKEGTLFIHFNQKLKASLEHWHYDTFRVSYEKAWITTPRNISFELAADGKITAIALGSRTYEKQEKTSQ